MIFLIFVIIFVLNIIYLSMCRAFMEKLDCFGHNQDGGVFGVNRVAYLLKYIFGINSVPLGAPAAGNLLFWIRIFLFLISSLFVMLLLLIFSQ